MNRARQTRTPGFRGAIAGALGLLLAITASPLQAGPSDDNIAFHVFRDGRPMGHHMVSFEQKGEELHVEVDILLEVDIAFITVFRYQHKNREVWRDGRLLAIETRTDDDGDDYWLRGKATAAGFEVEGSGGSFLAPADVMPTSYWNPETIARRQLLDTQKGRLIEVAIAESGQDEVRLPEGSTEAARYAVTGDLKLDLWYSPQGEWVKTAFSLRGSDFAYARKDHPTTLATSEGSAEAQ